MVHILWLFEWPEGSRILMVYHNKKDAEDHLQRLENMSGAYDECHYSIQSHEVI